jgi:uncharacterized membrane protein YbaN (DUF454 family)
VTDEAATSEPDLAASRTRIGRLAWTAAGFLSVGFGGLGIVLPGLPTTVFFIIAAWCFSKGNPRFEQWVLDLPKIGPLVRDHRAGLGMPRRAKVIATSMMWTAIALSSWLLRDQLAWVAVIVVLGLIGTAYIRYAVPTKEDVTAGVGHQP